MSTSSAQLVRRVAAGGLLALPLLTLPACRGDRSDERPRQFLPDMDDSPKFKNQEGTEFFVDGRQMRPPPAHTVAFGRVSFLSDEPWAAPYMLQRTDLLKESDAFYLGYTSRTKVKAADGTESEKFEYVDRIPVPVDEALLTRGAERFNIYCVVCHGFAGDGKGMVGQRWAATVPTWHDPKYSDPREPDGKGTDGFFFVTARNGVPGPAGFAGPADSADDARAKREAMKMPGYAHALSERDAWAVVAYIRVLQESHRGTEQDIPADQRAEMARLRQELISKAPPPEPAPPAPGAGGARK